MIPRTHPVDAQKRLCHMIGDLAEISSAGVIADIGSGILGPAKIWSSQYPSLQISSVNVNFSQLSSVNSGHISKLNSTARMLPFSDFSIRSYHCTRICTTFQTYWGLSFLNQIVS